MAVAGLHAPYRLSLPVPSVAGTLCLAVHPAWPCTLPAPAPCLPRHPACPCSVAVMVRLRSKQGATRATLGGSDRAPR